MSTKAVKEKASAAPKKTKPTAKKPKKAEKGLMCCVQNHPLKSLLLCGTALGLVIKKLMKKNKK